MLIKCPECKKEISNESEKCIYCGYPINVNKISDSGVIVNTSKRKIILVAIIVIIFVVSAIFITFIATNDSRIYDRGVFCLSNKNYSEAIVNFSKIENYKDSKKLKQDAQHSLNIINDKTPPRIENAPEEFSIGVGREFNAEAWVRSVDLKVTDDVSGSETKVYVDSRDLNTEIYGTYQISIIATDEAGNISEKVVDINVEKKKEPYEENEIIYHPDVDLTDVGENFIDQNGVVLSLTGVEKNKTTGHVLATVSVTNSTENDIKLYVENANCGIARDATCLISPNKVLKESSKELIFDFKSVNFWDTKTMNEATEIIGQLMVWIDDEYLFDAPIVIDHISFKLNVQETNDKDNSSSPKSNSAGGGYRPSNNPEVHNYQE